MTEETNNIGLKSDPLADPIVETCLAVRKAKLVTQSVELGIFDDIETFNNPVTAVMLADKRGYNRDITERLLNALVCFKLLEKSTSTTEASSYSNSPSTTKYLVQLENRSMFNCLICEFEMMVPVFGKISHALKEGSNDQIYQNLIGGNDIIDENCNLKVDTTHVTVNMKKKPSPQMFMSLMDDILAPSAHAITKAFDLTGHKIMLDLGGSSGYLAYEFIKAYPQMKAIVFDLPETIAIAKKHQKENMKSQIHFVAGDFFKNQLPNADLIVLSHVIHNWNKERIDIILQKAFDTLPPGGCILLTEKCLSEGKTGPETCVLLDITMAVLCEGRERTGNEYTHLLQEHGFRQISVKQIDGLNSNDVIIASKPF